MNPPSINWADAGFQAISHPMCRPSASLSLGGEELTQWQLKICMFGYCTGSVNPTPKLTSTLATRICMAKVGLLLHKEADNRGSAFLISGFWTNGSLMKGREGCRLIKTTCSVRAPRLKWAGSIANTTINVRNRACRQTRFGSLI